MLSVNGMCIGLFAEDREAARVASTAVSMHYTPQFHDALGPFLSVQFAAPPPPLPTETTMTASSSSSPAAAAAAPSPVALPLLYGWVRRLPADSAVQLMRELRDGEGPEATPGVKPSRAAAPPGTPRPAAIRGVVCGQLSHALHLWSTPHATRALLAYRGSGADDGPSDGSADRTKRARDVSADGADDAALFNAWGETVSLPDGAARDRELRDDTAMLHGAVTTILRCGRALRENPNAAVTCYTEEDGSAEYLKFA